MKFFFFFLEIVTYIYHVDFIIRGKIVKMHIMCMIDGWFFKKGKIVSSFRGNGFLNTVASELAN